MLGRILYFGLIKPVSFLPFFVLYRVSDVLYYIIYYGTKYRRKIVASNLSKSFPEKSEGEIKCIEIKFYRHLCDVIIEAIKFFSISKKAAHQRFQFTNKHILDEPASLGRSIVAVTSHYNNWELGSICGDTFGKYKQTALINNLSDGYLNKKLKESRERFGLDIMAKRNLATYLKTKKGRLSALLILGDQSPTSDNKVYWTEFLQQKTAVATGAERIAKRYNMPVFYFHIKKIKRGYYQGEIVPIAINPSILLPYEITERHTRLLESKILDKPEYWLWSHRRWKLLSDA